jgi:hypothetical protein
MYYHYEASRDHQMRISKALGGDANVDGAIEPAPRLIRDLVSTLPGVWNEHAHANVTEDMILEFARYLFDNHIDRINSLSPRTFHTTEDIYGMLTKPLADL